MILAIETATLQAGVALLDAGGRIVAARAARVTTHSERLMALVAEVLAEAGLAPASLHAVACGAGPGSFTGLRIGLATAKGLCLAIDRPLLMISSLAALALRAPPASRVVACIDAFKGEVYAGRYLRLADDDPRGPVIPDGAALSAGEPVETVLAPERLAARLAAELTGEAGAWPLRLAGDVLERWPVLAVAGVDLADRAPPDAESVARLARWRLSRGEHDALAAAVPAYIRPSEAEIHGPPKNLPVARKHIES